MPIPVIVTSPYDSPAPEDPPYTYNVIFTGAVLTYTVPDVVLGPVA